MESIKPRKSKLERYSEELLAISLYGNPGLIKMHIRNYAEVDMGTLSDDLIYLLSGSFVEYDKENRTYHLTPKGMITADEYSKWRRSILLKLEMEEIPKCERK